MASVPESHCPSPSTIIASNKKDLNYLNELESLVSGHARNVFGTRFYVKYHSFIVKSTRLTYYLLTTVAGNQTLGEERFNLLPITNSSGSSLEELSMVKRLMLALVTTFSGDLLKRTRNQFGTISDELWNTLMEMIGKTNQIAFFFGDSFSTIIHRALMITYMLTVRKQTKEANAGRRLFQVTGFLLLVNFSLKFYAKWRTFQQKAQIDTSDGAIDTDDGKDDKLQLCTLCQHTRSQPTALPCGHVFCWHCIQSWLATNHYCPMCRVVTNRMICLHDYH